MVDEMNEEFKSLEELYNRVKPALYSKLKEVRRLGFNMINEVDIWNYNVENNWKKRENLLLHEIISDILNSNNYDINEYVMKRLNKYKENEEIITDSLI